MKKKQIKRLALASFTKNNLDSKKVKRFTGKMTKRELREYVKYLKTYDLGKKVYVLVPNLLEIDNPKMQKEFTKLFPNKKIIYKETPELILGIRVVNNDKVYDFNLQNSFESMRDIANNL